MCRHETLLRRIMLLARKRYRMLAIYIEQGNVFSEEHRRRAETYLVIADLIEEVLNGEKSNDAR